MQILLAIAIYFAIEIWHKDAGYFIMGLGNSMSLDSLIDAGRWIVQTENRAYKKTLMLIPFLVMIGISMYVLNSAAKKSAE